MDAFGETAGAPRASVIIPAYNEAATIGRLLEALRDVHPSIEILVACNGCHDATADICRFYEPRVKVLIRDQPGKVNALNQALQETSGPIKIIVDADVLIGARDVERLVELAGRPGVDVVQPRLHYNVKNCNYAVRAYMRAWVHHPYFRTKVGGAYALSSSGVAKLGAFPDVVADDEFVRRTLFDGVVWTDEACAHVYMPTSLLALIRIRSRSLSGATKLERAYPELAGLPVPAFRPMFLRMLFGSQPMSAVVYAFVAVAARLRGRTQRRSPAWERDETSREPGQFSGQGG